MGAVWIFGCVGLLTLKIEFVITEIRKVILVCINTENKNNKYININ